jgi:hypothetical protein
MTRLCHNYTAENTIYPAETALRRPTDARILSLPPLLATCASVQLNPASDHWLDEAEFQSLTGRSDVPGLERAEDWTTLKET